MFIFVLFRYITGSNLASIGPGGGGILGQIQPPIMPGRCHQAPLPSGRLQETTKFCNTIIRALPCKS